jgi:hypothetical protein
MLVSITAIRSAMAPRTESHQVIRLANGVQYCSAACASERVMNFNWTLPAS